MLSWLSGKWFWVGVVSISLLAALFFGSLGGGEFVSQLCASDFMPHGHCYLWRPEILYLHVGSDALVALSYFTIPACLVVYARRKSGMKFSGVLWLFSGFILFCGLSHLAEIYSVWYGAYRLTGLIKLGTALISVATAVYLIRSLPSLLSIPLPSESRAVQDRLKSREDLFEAILKGGVDGFVTVRRIQADEGLGFAIEECNDNALNVIRREAEAVEGMEVRDALPFAEPVGLVALLERSLKDGAPWSEEVFYEDESQRLLSMQLQIVPAGELLAISFLDTTQARETERNLKEALEANAAEARRERDISAARSEAALATAIHGVLIVDELGKIVQVNNQLCEFFGYSEEALVGEGMDMLLPKELQGHHRSLRENYMKAPVKRGMGSSQSLQAMRKDGSLFPVEVGLNPFETVEGRFVMASVVDISERIKSRQALQASELRLKQAASGGRVGVWHWFNVESSQEWWSAEFYEILGYEMDEIPSTLEQFGELLHPDDRERTFALAKECISGNRAFEIDYRLKHKSLGFRWYYGTGVSVTDEGTGVISMVGSIQDIQFRKDSENELKEAYGELESRNKDTEQMMYAISHDLKSPIVSIRGLLQLIGLEGAELPERVGENLDRIERLAVNMGELITGLLEMWKVGLDEEGIEEIDTNEVMLEVRELLAGDLRNAKAKIESANPLPVVLARKQRIRQLLQNLCSNAVKYGCPEPEGVVEVGSRESGEFVEIYVRDHGPGIEEAYRERVFELFQRLDKSKEGTGVGLAIVHKVMTLYDGSVDLRSPEGGGAEFVLRFPRKRIVTS